jgi:hypothetical protein
MQHLLEGGHRGKSTIVLALITAGTEHYGVAHFGCGTSSLTLVDHDRCRPYRTSMLCS